MVCFGKINSLSFLLESTQRWYFWTGGWFSQEIIQLVFKNEFLTFTSNIGKYLPNTMKINAKALFIYPPILFIRRPWLVVMFVLAIYCNWIVDNYWFPSYLPRFSTVRLVSRLRNLGARWQDKPSPAARAPVSMRCLYSEFAEAIYLRCQLRYKYKDFTSSYVIIPFKLYICKKHRANCGEGFRSVALI